MSRVLARWSRLAAAFWPSLFEPGQVIRETVTAKELPGDPRYEALVEGIAGGSLLGDRRGRIRCSGVIERRAVHERPRLDKAPEGFGQDFDVAVLALTHPPVVVNGLREAVQGTRGRRVLAGVCEIARDGTRRASTRSPVTESTRRCSSSTTSRTSDTIFARRSTRRTRRAFVFAENSLDGRLNRPKLVRTGADA
jgi:hypothetical protein